MARPKKDRTIQPPLSAFMKQAAEERHALTGQLRMNTQAMRGLAADAKAQGVNVPDIAHHLGVTKRTVYLWLK